MVLSQISPVSSTQKILRAKLSADYQFELRFFVHSKDRAEYRTEREARNSRAKEISDQMKHESQLAPRLADNIHELLSVNLTFNHSLRWATFIIVVVSLKSFKPEQTFPR